MFHKVFGFVMRFFLPLILTQGQGKDWTSFIIFQFIFMLWLSALKCTNADVDSDADFNSARHILFLLPSIDCTTFDADLIKVIPFRQTINKQRRNNGTITASSFISSVLVLVHRLFILHSYTVCLHNTFTFLLVLV